MTTDQVVVMGRKTFESIGKPLPNRTTIILSRSNFQFPNVKTISDLEQLDADWPELAGKEIYICGGAQIYEQALPLCSDLFLTLVKRKVEGDTFFPEFEQAFQQVGVMRDCPEFKILHYKNSNLLR
nr:Dihydrofolate reductase [uncultured bacterium]